MNKFKIAVVTSEFNREITRALEQNCLRELKKSGVSSKNISITHVPGAFEIPLACQNIIKKQKPSAVIALGCIIRGKTAHFDLIARACSMGIMNVCLATGTPIAFGVITAYNFRQARERVNKGSEAAQAVLQLFN